MAYRDFPFQLKSCVWEITLACCFRCAYCGSRGGKARENELTTAECLDVARQLAEMGCRRASVIGGVSLAGGYGDILGTFIGAIFMAALENGVLKLQMNTAYQYVIKGCIIIAVVIFDAWFNSVMEKRAQEAAAGGKEE